MRGTKKRNLKWIIDTCMTLVLLCLMAYQVCGEVLHEWGGIVMTLLLIFHHVLNRRWYAGLFKGRYNAYRVVTAVVNTLLLGCIALTALCGMSMSTHAVPFLYGLLPVSFARQFHLALSFWSFVLMGFHLGLHIPAMTAGLKWSGKIRTVLSLLFAVVAGLGFRLFLNNSLSDYMFFRTPFAFLDYDKAAALVFAENLAILIAFALPGTCCAEVCRAFGKKDRKRRALPPLLLVLLSVGIAVVLTLCTDDSTEAAPSREAPKTESPAAESETARDNSLNSTTGPVSASGSDDQRSPAGLEDGFLLLPGGSFRMGSPETENWRIDDETLHEVTLSAFYIDPYETTQEEYTRLMGRNPSAFQGEHLPAESLCWQEAIEYANARSLEAGLTPAYTVSGSGVAWDRSANGYRLPTEAEWEYACRAGTQTPFNTEHSLDADQANFYGHYPYEIEENYFNDAVLEARPGQYRQTTVEVGSFCASPWGLYDMHGNVNEWCWDYYGAYDLEHTDNPAGPSAGTRHVYRGGGWNDFGKNMRSAYRAAGQTDLKAANLGVRLVRNAEAGLQQTVSAAETLPAKQSGGRVLIAFFSWSGNTRGIAREIQTQTGADIFEIALTKPYSANYNTLLMEAQEDQHNQTRPEIVNPPEGIDEYDVILLGYPNWWASIPMPIASFLELYDFSGKTIVPFCSHGGGRFGQSLTAIAKLAPEAVMGEGLSVHYSGGASLPEDVAVWLEANGIPGK